MGEKKPKKTKYVRTFRHLCDDFVITDDDGNEYYPHAGEWVVFRADIPFGVFQFNEDMTNGEYAELSMNILLRQIRDWNWTDEEGVPYPKPEDAKGFVWALADLSESERWYLRNHCWEKASLGEAKSSES